MTKELKEGDVVWIAHDGFAIECKIMQQFAVSKSYIVAFAGNLQKSFVCSPNECYETKRECQEAYDKNYKEKFNMFYEQFGETAELFAFLFYGCLENCQNNEIAMEAALKRATELTGIDMKSYFEKYCDDMRKEDFRKKK